MNPWRGGSVLLLAGGERVRILETTPNHISQPVVLSCVASMAFPCGREEDRVRLPGGPFTVRHAWFSPNPFISTSYKRAESSWFVVTGGESSCPVMG